MSFNSTWPELCKCVSASSCGRRIRDSKPCEGDGRWVDFRTNSGGGNARNSTASAKFINIVQTYCSGLDLERGRPIGRPSPTSRPRARLWSPRPSSRVARFRPRPIRYWPQTRASAGVGVHIHPASRTRTSKPSASPHLAASSIASAVFLLLSVRAAADPNKAPAVSASAWARAELCCSASSTTAAFCRPWMLIAVKDFKGDTGSNRFQHGHAHASVRMHLRIPVGANSRTCNTTCTLPACADRRPCWLR